MSKGLKLLLDGARGTYIPRDFVEGYNVLNRGTGWEEYGKWEGIDAEDVEILKNPEHYWYWETWDSVLGNASYIDSDGNKWRLYQDCDLWVYCDTMMTILEQEEFGFDVDMEAHIEKHGFRVIQCPNHEYRWEQVEGQDGDLPIEGDWLYSRRLALRDCIKQNGLDTIPE